MRRKTLAMAALLVGGCAIVHPVSRGATLILKPQVLAGVHTQTLLNPYDLTSIHHLKLEVMPLVEGVPQAKVAGQTLLNAQLDNSVVFSNLKANTRYRIQASAYHSADDTQLISIPASSSTDIIVLSDDRPTLSTLPVALIDRPFNGQASSSLNVIAGSYTPVASESAAFDYSPLLGVVTTFAGVNGSAGYADGTGIVARFSCIQCITSDNAGNLYLADQNNHVIRKISLAGVVSTFVGTPGTAGNVDGTGISALLNQPVGLAINRKTGDLYFNALNSYYIRKVSPSGVVTAFVGSSTPGFVDGTGTAARFSKPYPFAIDSQGNLFVPDVDNQVIRKVTPQGVVTTFAGSGVAGHQDGQGLAAQFDSPYGCAIDASDNLYVTEYIGKIIRKITPSGMVSTLAGTYKVSGSSDGTGTAASFSFMHGITCDPGGNVIVSDYSNRNIRKITPTGVVTTLAGGAASLADGFGTAAGLGEPRMSFIDRDGTYYFGDRHCLRRIR